MARIIGIMLGISFGLPLFAVVMVLRRAGRCHGQFWAGVVIGGAVQCSVVAIAIVVAIVYQLVKGGP